MRVANRCILIDGFMGIEDKILFYVFAPLLVAWVASGVLATYFAVRKNRNGKLWFSLGLLFGFLAMVAIWGLPPLREAEISKEVGQETVVYKVEYEDEPLLVRVFARLIIFFGILSISVLIGLLLYEEFVVLMY